MFLSPFGILSSTVSSPCRGPPYKTSLHAHSALKSGQLAYFAARTKGKTFCNLVDTTLSIHHVQVKEKQNVLHNGGYYSVCIWMNEKQKVHTMVYMFRQSRSKRFASWWTLQLVNPKKKAFCIMVDAIEYTLLQNTRRRRSGARPPPFI